MRVWGEPMRLFAVALLAAMSALAAPPSWAESPIGTGGKAQAPARAAAQAADDRNAGHVPIASIQSTGGDGSQVIPGSTFTPLGEPRTLVCPGPTKCRVEADIWASLYAGSTTANSFGLCGFIDGQQMNQPGGGASGLGCPYTGQVPSDGSVIGATQITSQSQVSPGAHSFQAQVYVRNGATLGLYSAQFRLTKRAEAGSAEVTPQ